MRHVKMLFGVLLALLVAGLATSAAAFAEEGVLPRPTNPVPITSGTGIFQSKGGLEVKGKTDEGELKFKTDNSGTFVIHFLKTTGPLGVSCKGLASTDEAGEITTQGSFTINKLTSGESAPGGTVVSPEETHFTCGSILDLVRGRVVGKISVSGTSGKIVLKQSKGVNELTSDSSESGIFLETSTAGGKFEQSGEETEETATYESATELMA